MKIEKRENLSDHETLDKNFPISFSVHLESANEEVWSPAFWKIQDLK
jgi:hypothetical protein